MPNKRTHTAVGATAGVAWMLTSQIKDNNYNSTELIGSAFGGLVGGQLPDIIDPPISPHHRKIGHSARATIAGAALLQKTVNSLKSSCKELESTADWNIQNGYDIPADIKMELTLKRLAIGFLNGLPAGYVSHLLLDSTTPAGIKL
jgi:membrane-bound metal-dependent hydrolase YbcI (DUF457 family)